MSIAQIPLSQLFQIECGSEVVWNSARATGFELDEYPVCFCLGQQGLIAQADYPILSQRTQRLNLGDPGLERNGLSFKCRAQIGDEVGPHDPHITGLKIAFDRPAAGG